MKTIEESDASLTAVRHAAAGVSATAGGGVR